MADEDLTKLIKDDVKSDTVEETEDTKTDDAVRGEGDDQLKTQDEQAAAVVMKVGVWERFKGFQQAWWSDPRKRWGTIVSIVVILVVLGVVPYTRYNISGLILKSNVTVEAIDSKSGEPVSGAQINLDGVTTETNGEGKAVLRSHTGTRGLSVEKKYYAGSKQHVLVTLSASQNTFKAKVVALGRKVSIKVTNKITGNPLEDAKVTASGASAKTNKAGIATVVIPSSATAETASVSLSGYNTSQVTITAGVAIAKDTFAVTPSGKIYFLSNLSGTIDVVKTNLDGSDRQTVLAGTGDEDPSDTSLLASRDWKYLALLSRRSGTNESLYLIDTTNGDKLSTIDEGNATFNLIGWSGDHFVYQVDRSATVSNWQPDQVALKSFDPTTGHTLLLDQTQGAGDQNLWMKQFFGQEYLIGSQVVYTKGWLASYPLETVNGSTMTGKQAELDAINADGTGHQVLKSLTYDGSGTTYVALDSQLYEPDGLYLAWDDGGSATNTYFEYDDGKVSTDPSLTDAQYNNYTSTTYLLSPSGNATFWSESRDGKNTLFIGNDDADNQKQIATLSDYNSYGWYTDNYVLVSKNSSELYIMPVGGGTPIQISDYYKPPINYYGYGGGYGGL